MPDALALAQIDHATVALAADGDSLAVTTIVRALRRSRALSRRVVCRGPTADREDHARDPRPIPKIVFTAEPGAILRAPLVEWCKANLPNLEVVPVGAGLHYVQEDNPDAIGAALARWIPALPA